MHAPAEGGVEGFLPPVRIMIAQDGRTLDAAVLARRDLVSFFDRFERGGRTARALMGPA
jgi:hypothetical protein